jgi:hypothetical protein
MYKQAVLTIVTALGTMSLAGCGNSHGPFPVQGKVLYHGAPAVGATVYFHRQGARDALHEHTPQGTVQEDGSFELASPVGHGAMPGAYLVLVQWKEGTGRGRGRGALLTAPDRLKGRYFNAQKPLLHADVQAAKTTLAPFELQ